MSNSSLVNYTRISPNSNARVQKITKVTVHHMAGNLSVETCGNVFASSSRQASSNYGIGSDGRVGLYVPEDRRAWTSSSEWNDQRAVTIEVANSSVGGDWPVSEAAWNKLVELVTDICRRNGISELIWTGDKNGSLTCHYMFKNTNCPGPYLKARMPELASLVTGRLRGQSDQPASPSAPASSVGAYTVKVNTADLNVRKGPGTNYGVAQTVHKNEVFTIVDESGGQGATKWGKLKSGAGWISLDFVART